MPPIRLICVAALSAPLAAWLTGCSAEWRPADGFEPEPVNLTPALTLEDPSDGARTTTLRPITVSGIIVDDGDPTELSVWVRSDRDGDLDTPAVDASGGFSTALTLSEGAHVLTVTATDAGDLSDSVSVSLTVDANQAPTQPAVSISPTEPGTTDDLLASLDTESADPDGDPITYTWSWRVDGADAGIDGDTVPADRTADDQLWEVEVYATDGALDSPAAAASVLVNDGPAVEVAIAPERPTVEDTVICSWTAVDPEGGDVSIEATWTVDGAAAGDAGAPLAGVFTKGQELRCEVSAVADSGGTISAASVAVINAPPVSSNVTLSPGVATEGSTLRCTADASDPDGDAVSLIYTWYVGGASVATGESLDGLWFNKDDTVWCEAAGDDGEDLGDPVASNSVVIGNTAPGAPTVEMSDTQVNPGEPLECLITAAAVDPDGDPLSYSFSWTADGAALGETGAVLSTGALGGRDITCAARADDGETSSPWSGIAEAVVLEAFGGDYTTDDASLTITGTEADASFTKVAVPGDLDGDGYDELVVSAVSADGGDGAVYVFSSGTLRGASSLADTDADWSWTGAGSLGDGESVSGINDLGGDGLSELIIGAFKTDVGATSQAGVAYLLRSDDRASWGGAITSDAALTIRGTGTTDYCGMAAGASDLDGDGLDDLFVGCYANDEAATNAGVVAIFTDVAALTGATSIADADISLTGGSSNDSLGYMGTRFVGDVDGDGTDDLFVTAYKMDGVANDSGVGFLINDGALASGEADAAAFARIEGLANGDRFARSSAGMGDVDGDGRADLVISADKDDRGTTDAGAVSFWYGGPTLAGTHDASEAAVTWYGSGASDYTGRFLAGGDLDGDGVGDVLVASPYDDDIASSGGSVALLSGADSASWTGDLRSDARAWIDGATGSNFLGFGLAMGDVSGDGLGDVIVGNLYGDDGASNAGTIFVFYGP